MVDLGLAIVAWDDGEGWVCSRGGSTDEVGGEVEGLTGVRATGVDDKMGAVTRRGMSEMNDGYGEWNGSKRPCAAGCLLGCRGRACRARRAKGGKRRAGNEPCRVLVPSECGLASRE